MKQATRQAPANRKSVTEHMHQRLREAILITTSVVALFLLLALFTYHYSDPSWSHVTNTNTVQNWGGKIGALSSDVLLFLMGYLSYLVPLMLFAGAWMFYKQYRVQDEQHWPYHLALRITGFLLVLLAGSALVHLHPLVGSQNLPAGGGGALGSWLGLLMARMLNPAGATLILTGLFLTGITLFTGLSWLRIADFIGAYVIRAAMSLVEKWQDWRASRADAEDDEDEDYEDEEDDEDEEEDDDDEEDEDEDEEEEDNRARAKSRLKAEKRIEPTFKTEKNKIKESVVVNKPQKIQTSLRAEQEKQSVLFEPALDGSLPPLSLLDPADKSKTKGHTTQQLEEMSREVELRLQDFGIDVKVVAVHPGPVVTRFELQLAAGTKVSRITTLAKDLARSLSVTSVRIVEVIPGKSVIGLEVPNENREVVRLREILSSQQYDNARSPLTLALGKDIAGHPVIVDLAKMPHLLAAGTTGSGKSVGLNAMLLSLLFKTTPDQLRMILIDPKMLELSVYEGIPHLLTPVVTDMKDASNALRWCVIEMDKRYKLMASLGVRNISGYNQKVKEGMKNGAPLLDPLWQAGTTEAPEELQEMPYIMVLIDEFADLMMVVGKKVEELIARLAQKARAAGIHLILATQRPSVDVITGLIKANIPTRIAFQVSSKIDSRTILDQAGAEQLLGYGDMLYLAPGTGVPVRVHGAFVADEEVHRVVSDIKRRGQPNYRDDILVDDGGATGDPLLDALMQPTGGDAEQDPLYDQAVQIVIEARRASISLIQRRLKIGYNRAANIMEAMEHAGLVSSMDSSGSREILVPSHAD